MKALTLTAYDGPQSLRFANADAPQPRPRDVLIKVHAASLNPVDAKITTGYARDRLKFKLPHVLGRDCSGVVAAVGAEVGEFKTGDEVFGVVDQMRWGTHAEYVAIDAATVARKPKRINHVEAASLPIAGLSALAGIVATGNLTRGQRVLVHAGAGGVGSFAIQLARHIGATVAATAGAANLDYVKSLGADVAIDYRNDDMAQRISDYDLVFDLMGGDVRYRSFAVLRPGGMIAHLSTPPMTQPAPRSDVTVKHAMVAYGTRDLDQISALIDSGAVKPTVSTAFPFARAVEGYERALSGHGRGKLVLDMTAAG